MGLKRPKKKVQSRDEVKAWSLPDSGAQVVVAGLNLMHSLGVTKGDLVKVKTNPLHIV